MTYWHNVFMVLWAALSVLLWKMGYEEEDSAIGVVVYFVLATLSTAGVVTVWSA